MIKVLVNDSLSKVGINYLKDNNIEVFEKKISQEQLINFINKNNINVLLVRSSTEVRKDIIDACPSIKIIGRSGVGLDNIDVEYAKKKGIHVINSPSASSKSVAELVFAHFFSIARYLYDFKKKIIIENQYQFNKFKKECSSGTELYGKTLGVIGFGRIGIETVKIGLALGMKILVNDFDDIKNNQSINLEFFNGKSMTFTFKLTSFKELIQSADYISLHVPKQKEYLFNKKEFDMMKDGVVIANVSRGGLIDENALINAIKSGKVKAAALDVFENEIIPNMELIMNNKIFISPHIGGSTIESQDRISKDLALQIMTILKNI